ncbi:MAG: AbrB family transcriptional regulator [Moorea sp. SIO3I7]|nr:AbrB family transcriptional regulator [Moorena sp. SIO3I7]
MEVPASLISVPVAQPELGSIQPLWSNLLFLVGCCSLGTLLGRWLRLPASAFLGSFLLGLTISWLFPHQFEVPRAAFSSALLLVGVSVGLRFSWQTVKSLWRVVLLEIGLIIILMLGCVGIGYEFHLVTHVDTMTALLGFVPGAIEAMVATATQLGGDTGTVVALQMTRQFLILLVINVLNVVYKQPDTTS